MVTSLVVSDFLQEIKKVATAIAIKSLFIFIKSTFLRMKR
jgi:hypothetical protein